MGKSRLLPSAEEVKLKKPYLCSQCRQVIQAGEKAVQRQIEILGPEGETRQVVTCYVHSGECPPKPEKKVVWANRSLTCHECRRVIKAGQQAAVWRPLGIKRKKQLYSHFPCCPPEVAEEVVTTDRERLCTKCRRVIPTGSQAVRTIGPVLDRWEEPVEIEQFYHYLCPGHGRRVRYNKKGEISI